MQNVRMILIYNSCYDLRIKSINLGSHNTLLLRDDDSQLRWLSQCRDRNERIVLIRTSYSFPEYKALRYLDYTLRLCTELC